MSLSTSSSAISNSDLTIYKLPWWKRLFCKSPVKKLTLVEKNSLAKEINYQDWLFEVDEHIKGLLKGAVKQAEQGWNSGSYENSNHRTSVVKEAAFRLCNMGLTAKLSGAERITYSLSPEFLNRLEQITSGE